MPFPKGRSGNPSGRKRMVPTEKKIEIAELARTYAHVAIETLAKVAKGGKSESAKVAAAGALLDRGFGKPTQPIAGDADGDPITIRTIVTGVPRPGDAGNN